MLRHNLKALFNPEQYHGWGKNQRFFEGWYYKVVSKDEQHAFAFIPGIAMDDEGRQQAFVQVLDGKQLKAAYHRYEAEAFVPTPGTFDTRVGESRFRRDGITLNLPDVSGSLQFHDSVPWPSSWYSPGIMGPFSFVPFMQCYHGILSMDHSISGVLDFENGSVDFEGGRGYMEKDWGRSFPSGYIWMQTNHFSEKGISIKSSIAKIPWLMSSFVGFISGVWLHDRLIQFTTYNLTRLRKVHADKDRVEIVMENNRHRLEILAHREAATALASPILGFMDGRIEESMTSTVNVQLTDKKAKRLLLDDVGRNAGLEVAGKFEEVLVG